MNARHYEVKGFTSEGSLGYLLKLAYTLMQDAAVAEFAEHDVSFMQWLVLMKLREGTQMTASELCRKMHHDNGALTRVVDHLEGLGFVERERSQDDRRVVKLQLTAAGRRKAADLIPMAVSRLNECTAQLTKTEFLELTRLLNKIIASMDSKARSAGVGASA